MYIHMAMVIGGFWATPNIVSKYAEGRNRCQNTVSSICCKPRRFSGYSVQRLKTRQPLVPPKPKEFDIAYSIDTLRAVCGT